MRPAVAAVDEPCAHVDGAARPPHLISPGAPLNLLNTGLTLRLSLLANLDNVQIIIRHMKAGAEALRSELVWEGSLHHSGSSG